MPKLLWEPESESEVERLETLKTSSGDLLLSRVDEEDGQMLAEQDNKLQMPFLSQI